VENVVDPAFHPPIAAITFNFGFWLLSATVFEIYPRPKFSTKSRPGSRLVMEPELEMPKNEYIKCVHSAGSIFSTLNCPFPCR